MSENKNAKTPADDGQPVAWMMVNKVIGPPSLHWKPREDWHITWECKPLYTAPPKREWVGLTADEIWKCNKAKSGSAVEFHICVDHQNVLDFAEAIEAKLKEKNGG